MAAFSELHILLSDIEQFIEGLTDPHIQVFTASSYVELINLFLKG